MPNLPTPRLLARLVAAIFAIAATLRPVIDAIAHHPAASWHHRARLANRFSTILQNLLALTAQIGPATLTPRPGRTPTPRAPQTGRTTPRHTPIPTAPRRAPTLSPRQLARRLAALLTQLIALANEAGALLPAALHHHIATARRLARCPAPPHPTWERAG